MKRHIASLLVFALAVFACNPEDPDISKSEEEDKNTEVDSTVTPVTPVDPVVELPVATLLDVVFESDGTAKDISPAGRTVETFAGSDAVVYWNEAYGRYVAHFNHANTGTLSSGFYKVDYTDDTDYKAALADGHSMEIVFRLDVDTQGVETKPFSSMQSGGTGFLITASSKGKDICFLPHVGGSWRWPQSKVPPTIGQYYHVVGVWDKEAGKAMTYIDGELKGTADAAGDFKFATTGNTWFCIGADPSAAKTAHCGWKGDVVLARIYDEPLTAQNVSDLYDAVKAGASEESVIINDILMLSPADVTAGGGYYIYGDGFRSGDVIELVSTLSEQSAYSCTTTVGDGYARITIPAALATGSYKVFVHRGKATYPLGTAELRIGSGTAVSFGTKIIAHRGYHTTNGAPENSVASLKAAQELGVYGSELDVYITTDGELVIYHDTSLKGTGDHADNASYAGLKPDECTYDQIKGYKLSNGEYLPTFDDILTQGLKDKSVTLIVEIKDHGSSDRTLAACDSCVAKVASYGMQEQVRYIAFSLDACKRLVKICPAGTQIAYLNGDLAPSTLNGYGINGISYSYSKLTDEWIASAHSLGMSVNVWTVNSVSSMLDYMIKGVDELTSNYPHLAVALLNTKFTD